MHNLGFLSQLILAKWLMWTHAEIFYLIQQGCIFNRPYLFLWGMWRQNCTYILSMEDFKLFICAYRRLLTSCCIAIGYWQLGHKRPDVCCETGSPAQLWLGIDGSWPRLVEDYTKFLPKQKLIMHFLSPSNCFSFLSRSPFPCGLVWMTASYLWMMLTWGRWHTAKLWRPLRRQVLSCVSTFSAENQQQRKSLKSNSSKGLKVCWSRPTLLCGFKDTLYPAKLCPLDLANLLCVNPHLLC